jgi:hypothetical protein
MPAFPAAEARHAPTSIRPDLCCIEIELGALLAGHPGCSRKWRRPRRAAG